MTKPRAERRGKSLGEIAHDAFWEGILPWSRCGTSAQQLWETTARAVIKAYRAKPKKSPKAKGK